MTKKISSRQVKIHFNESFDGSQETDDTVINIVIENPTAGNVEDLKSQIDKALINLNPHKGTQ